MTSKPKVKEPQESVPPSEKTEAETACDKKASEARLNASMEHDKKKFLKATGINPPLGIVGNEEYYKFKILAVTKLKEEAGK